MKKFLIWFCVLIILGLAGWLVWEVEQPYQGYRGSQIVTIHPGSSAQDIAQTLVDRGVLAYQLPFLARYGIGKERHRTLKAGEYQFDRPLSPADVYWKLARGEVYLHSVVIPEGSDRFDMGRIFAAAIGVNPTDFLAATARADLVRDLDPKAPSLEGYLFPDTYLLPRAAPVTEIVRTMLARFRQVAQQKLHLSLNPAPPNLHEVMTLASLVEKETPNPAERAMIAGVFARRLERGMPLQCDPTVIYALRLNQGFPNLPSGAPSHDDLAVNSSYNTYVHAGLPPGPICSPGEASIQAALHPAPGDALYFVSNHHGAHYFANTLEEQNRNVNRYRRELKENSEAPSSSPPSTAAAKKETHEKTRGHQAKKHAGNPQE
ncbi:MAG: endolytic transglycosylase MltG [Terriglobia bacterium]